MSLKKKTKNGTIMEYVIPLRREDLMNLTDSIQYRVEELLTPREIINRWGECQEALEKQGPPFITEHFDVFYSWFSHSKKLEAKLGQDMFHLMKRALSVLLNDLNLLLEDSEAIDDCLKFQYRNTVKMVTYILCQQINEFETASSNLSTQVILMGKGRKRVNTKQVCASNDGWDWQAERLQTMQLLQQLCILQLHWLWCPPVIEEDFINLISNCCYKCLENPMINQAKELKEVIFHVLGNLLKKQTNVIGSSVKVVQLLQLFEHLAAPLAQAIVIFVEDYGMQQIVNEVIREIGNAESKDLSSDGSGTRSFSHFLVEVSQRLPALIISNIGTLATHLDGDAYTMRNCVLGIMGEILQHTLQCQDLDEKSRALRDQFMDRLEDHIHDINAFVRSRVLQIWVKLCQAGLIPIVRQKHLLKLNIGRLNDKSCLVRKHAIELLTAILKSNPFAAELSLNELNEKLISEKAKLLTLEDQQNVAVNEGQKRKICWPELKEEVKNIIEVALHNKNINSGKKAEHFSAAANNVMPLEDMINIVKTYLDEANLQSAVAVLLDNYRQQASWQPILANNTTENEPDEMQTLKSEILDMLKYICSMNDLSNLSTSSSVIMNGSNGDSVKNTLPQSSEQMKQKALIRYLKDAIKFVELMNEALQLVIRLLGSRQNTDVLEAIHFFVTAAEFGLHSAHQGIKQMLTLIWSKEAPIKAAVVAAYKKIYLNPETPKNGHHRNKHELIVDNLTTLTREATLGELASFEELICELIKNGELSDKIFKVLLQRFINNNNAYSNADSHAAIVLLGMVGGAKGDLIKNNLHLFTTIGLCERAANDFTFARDVCSALLKLHDNVKPSNTSKEGPFRMPSDHLIFKRIADLLIKGFENLNDCMWIPMMEVAIDVLYKLAEHPEEICEDIIKTIIRKWRMINGDATEQKCPSLLLTRFLSLSGHISLCQMNHLDVNILGELKRRHEIREAVAAASKKRTKKHQTPRHINAGAATSEESSSNMLYDDSELTGAVIDDRDVEFINKICEKAIVAGGKNCLGWLAQFIVAIASNPGLYSDSNIQRAASLALSKCMMVSTDFCDAHMQLLITILEKSLDPRTRANIIVALGTLICRFPNVVDPWSSHLYHRLQDESFQVQYNALVTLTQLILHDMVKVKGPISDMALCIVDKDERISRLAKRFFQELAKKGNSIYNVLPDIISRMSDPEVGTSEENFQVILRYLLPFVQKDKLIENMVEQLCQRFHCTRLERQWRDLSFCIAQLCANDKCYRKLLDNFSCYADKLVEPKVYGCFCNMLTLAKKSIKIENKALIEELEEKLEESHNKVLEEAGICSKATKAIKNGASKTVPQTADVPPTPVNRITRHTRVTRTTARERAQQLETSTHKMLPRRNPRRSREKKGPPLNFSSSDEGDHD